MYLDKKSTIVSWLQNLRDWFQFNTKVQSPIQCCLRQIPYRHDDFQSSVEGEHEEEEEDKKLYFYTWTVDFGVLSLDFQLLR